MYQPIIYLFQLYKHLKNTFSGPPSHLISPAYEVGVLFFLLILPGGYFPIDFR